MEKLLRNDDQDSFIFLLMRNLGILEEEIGQLFESDSFQVPAVLRLKTHSVPTQTVLYNLEGLSKEEADDCLHYFDADGNGKINFEG